MWTHALHQRLDSGWALPNAIRDTLPTNDAASVEAGATLLMAALSMPDLATPRTRARPERMGFDCVGFGESVMHIQRAQATQDLLIRVEPAAESDTARSETLNLADFVGQVMLLRACGEHQPMTDWLRSYLP